MHQKTSEAVTVEINCVFHSRYIHTHTQRDCKIHIYFVGLILFKKMSIHMVAFQSASLKYAYAQIHV